MVINTNSQSAYSARVLSASTSNLSKSLARLSSGSRIVSPEDDAAGLAVSMKFQSEIKRIGAARSNVGNAISYAQTQDGFLSTVDSALRRMSELATLANDGTKSSTDLSNYNLEFSELKNFVKATAQKQFNGVDLFGGGTVSATEHKTSDGTSVNFKAVYDAAFDSDNDLTDGDDGTYYTWKADPTAQNATEYTGVKVIQRVAADLADLVNKIDQDDATADAAYDTTAWNLTVSFWESKLGTSYQAAKGHLGTATVDADGDDSSDNATDKIALANTMSSDIVADYNRLMMDIKFYIDTDIAGGKISVTDSSNLDADNSLLKGTGSYKLLAANLNTIVTAIDDNTDADQIANALDATTAALYVERLNTHINTLGSQRANVGANISRLNMVESQLAVYGENLSAANSRIADVDVATESAEYARSQILVQSGTAMLAQANVLPQSALMLLS